MSYSQGPVYSTVGKVKTGDCTGSNIVSFLTFLKNQMEECGWTVLQEVDGAGGTKGYKMMSYPTPGNGVIMRVTFWYNGPNTPFEGYQIYFAFSDNTETYYSGIKDIGGTFGTLTIQTKPFRYAGSDYFKNFRIYSGPHQVFIRTHDDYLKAAGQGGLTNQNSIHWGVPVVFEGSTQPTWWSKWEGYNATTFSQFLRPSNANYTCSYYIAGIYSTGQWMSSSDPFTPQLLTFRRHSCVNTVVFRGLVGTEDRYPIILPRLVTGVRNTGIVTACPLWDSFVSCGIFNKRIRTNIDGKTWENYTVGDPLGSLFLLVGPAPSNPSNVPGYSH